jgi:hypothetical protein
VPRETGLCPNLLQLQHARRGIAAPSKLQRLQSCKTGIIAQKGQKGPAGNSTGVSRRTFFSKYITSDRSFALLFAAPSQQEQQQSSGKNKQQDTNQTSDQSAQAQNVNSNATDLFPAFTMAQQRMTELSGAATEKEKVAV